LYVPEGWKDVRMRLARAVVFAVVCAVVSAAGHSYAGGAAVAPGVMAAGGLLALGLAYGLGGRERGPEVVLGATVGAQAVLHELFDLTAPGALAGHTHPGTGTGPGAGMVMVHLVIAVLTGWWLYRGESACWLMLRLAGRPRLVVPLLLRAVPAVEPVRPVYARTPPRPMHREPDTAPLRGPPARGPRTG
jgi:hypothetical protein